MEAVELKHADTPARLNRLEGEGLTAAGEQAKVELLPMDRWCG